MLRTIATQTSGIGYLCCMYLHSSYLLIKLYQDKPSRIGIRYTYEFQALKPYEEMVRKFGGHSFSMKLEPKSRQQIQLSLCSDQSGDTILYQDLLYKPEDLKKLMQTGKSLMPLEFVHVYSSANTILIAKPFKQKNFFSIRTYEVVGINEFY